MKIKNIFKKQNLHIQKYSYSCGPCALINILKMKNRDSLSEEELIKLCKVKPGKGISPNSLKEVIKKLDLTIIDERGNADIVDIEKNIDLDSYVIVLYYHAFRKTGHYAVITEYDDKAFYLADSSFGFIRIEKKVFLDFWHNSKKTICRKYIAVK